jgi:hypothetical protein
VQSDRFSEDFVREGRTSPCVAVFDVRNIPYHVDYLRLLVGGIPSDHHCYRIRFHGCRVVVAPQRRGLIWASALGGYLGCLVAEWYENWSLIEPMLVRWRYDYLLDRLVLPECFVFALGGELAAVLLLAFLEFTLYWSSMEIVARAD